MTTKSYSQLISSFPDNTGGLITPQNMRDFVDSVTLYFDNTVIVKTGQPVGNQFPPAVAGVHTLANNTLYVINGAVTCETLLLPANSAIISASNDPYIDSLILSVTRVGQPLFRQTSAGAIINIQSLTLSCVSATSFLFDFTNPSITSILGCVFGLSSQATNLMGSLSASSTTVNIQNCVAVKTTGALQFSGANQNGRFSISTGFGTSTPVSDIVNFGSSTWVDVRIESCNYTMPTGKFVFASCSAPTSTRGYVAGNSSRSTNLGGLINPVTASSTNFYFSANFGTSSTSEQGTTHYRGGLFATAGVTTTTIPSLNTWTPVALAGDVLASASVGFSRPSAGTLQYIGSDIVEFTVLGSLSVKRTSNGTTQIEATIFVNGVQILVNGTIAVNPSSTLVNQTTQQVTVDCPIILNPNDQIRMYVREVSGLGDVICDSIQFTIT